VAKQYNEISLDVREHIERWLYKNGASRDDAEDAVQSALLAYHRRSASTVIDNVQGWLMRVASDDWKDICRVKNRWITLHECWMSVTGTVAWEDRIVSSIVLSQLLLSLSSAEAEILTYEAQGFSREEMARCLGITEEAVKKRLYRARNRAKKLFATEMQG
jgi:DNA-directed RNA polymerase specialized sigma24 family protein